MIGIRVYVHGASVGDGDGCCAQLRPIFEAARGWNKGVGRIRCGVTVIAVESAEEAYGEFIDLAKTDQVTGGRYPFLYVNITYDPDRLAAEEFGPFEERFGLLPVSATSIPGCI